MSETLKNTRQLKSMSMQCTHQMFSMKLNVFLKRMEFDVGTLRKLNNN